MVPCPTEMSIQPTSVVRRIVEDARSNPRADLECEVLAPGEFRATGTGTRQRVTWIRAPLASFTTAFEFWTHALRVWLLRAGVAERFEPIVGNALCEPVSEAELRGALASRSVDMRGSFANAYRMLDQDLVESYVIETDAEIRAYFWEDLDWL